MLSNEIRLTSQHNVSNQNSYGRRQNLPLKYLDYYFRRSEITTSFNKEYIPLYALYTSEVVEINGNIEFIYSLPKVTFLSPVKTFYANLWEDFEKSLFLQEYTVANVKHLVTKGAILDRNKSFLLLACIKTDYARKVYETQEEYSMNPDNTKFYINKNFTGYFRKRVDKDILDSVLVGDYDVELTRNINKKVFTDIYERPQFNTIEEGDAFTKNQNLWEI